jgi:hypothetical protein
VNKKITLIKSDNACAFVWPKLFFSQELKALANKKS